jgi:ABC-type Mn2+/Zn2+ transport system permease subunit
MQRAFVATTVLSASVAPIGAFLVLRRLSLAGVVAAALTALLARKTILRSDASLASIYHRPGRRHLYLVRCRISRSAEKFPIWVHPRH